MDKLNSLPDACFPNIGIAFQELNRVAFSLFGLDIYWYGVFICLGVVAGTSLLYFSAKKTGQDPDPYIDFLFWGIICGIIGARTYYLIFHDKSIKNFFAFREGGLAIYGGVIGAVIAVLIYTKAKKIPLYKFADTYAPSLLLGQVVGRLGNFVNREAFGRATNCFFSLMYKAEQVPNIRLEAEKAIYRGVSEYPLTIVNGTAYISVHPTFLYELTWNFMTVVIMLLYRKHKRFEGEISAMYLLFYGTGRFFIESLRTDQLMIGKIPVSMLVSAVIAITGLVIIAAARFKKKSINIK